MRIISGSLKGRIIPPAATGLTHPMGERVRSALFNALNVRGKDVLDAYAGTGAIGFEAVSRGARSVFAIEVEKKAVQSIARLRREWEIEDKHVLKRQAVRPWAKQSDQMFQIIIADPPYNNIDRRDLALLGTHLTIDGIMVVSWPPREKPLRIDGLEMYDQKSYGDALLLFFAPGATA